MDHINNYKSNYYKNHKQKVQYANIFQDFLSKYPLIANKFKINKKSLPNAQFDIFNKHSNSIIIKSTNYNELIHTQTFLSSYGVIFQQALQKTNKQKYYEAICYQGNLNQFQHKQGFGFAIFDNGDTYQGHWQNNLINGNGIYISNQNKSIYQGGFIHWKKQGHGKLTSNVNKKFTYQGSFKDNQFNGHGILQFQDGQRYQGQFTKGYQQGSGIYTTKSMKYEGSWKKGYMSGAGKAFWHSQQGQVVSKYTGQYYEGKKHGFGQYQIKNGKLLRGQWFQGKFNPTSNSHLGM